MTTAKTRKKKLPDRLWHRYTLKHTEALVVDSTTDLLVRHPRGVKPRVVKKASFPLDAAQRRKQ